MKTLEKLRENLDNLKLVKNSKQKDLLKVIFGEIDRMETKNPTEDEVIKLLKKMKQYAIECDNDFEVSFIDVYLPKMFTTAQTKELVEKIVEANNFSTMRDLGSVMKLINTDPNVNLINKKEAVDYVKQLLN